MRKLLTENSLGKKLKELGYNDSTWGYKKLTGGKYKIIKSNYDIPAYTSDELLQLLPDTLIIKRKSTGEPIEVRLEIVKQDKEFHVYYSQLSIVYDDVMFPIESDKKLSHSLARMLIGLHNVNLI